jgi:hypothetical protein
VLVACLLLAGCSDGSSTVLVTITAPGLSVATLSVEIDTGDADAGLRRALADGGAPTLPASLIVIVGDTGPTVHVHLDASLADGTALAADGTVQSTPHHQVTLPLTLTGTLGDGGDGGGPDLPDLTVPVDLEIAPDLNGIDLSSHTVLSEDTFMRADQVLWGTASDGIVWNGEANTANFSSMFSIASNLGQVTNTGNSSRMGRLGPKVNDMDVFATGSTNDFTQTHFGALARVEDSNNFYKAIIDGGALSIQITQAGVNGTLASTPFVATDGVSYTVRLQAIGSALSAKAWPSAQAEPAGWQLSITDVAFANGQCGVRALAPTTTTWVRFSHLLCWQY